MKEEAILCSASLSQPLLHTFPWPVLHRAGADRDKHRHLNWTESNLVFANSTAVCVQSGRANEYPDTYPELS